MKALDVDEDGNPQALQHVNVRLPRYVVEYFKRSTHYTAQIRKVLQDHVDNYKEQEQDDEVRILMNVHCLLCLAIFPENSTASTVDTCPNCGNADKKQIIHLQEPDDAPKKVIWLYGLTQSCLDKKGQHAVSSVDEIDTRYHWVDIEKLSNDKNAYWLELVEKYGWEVDEMHGYT